MKKICFFSGDITRCGGTERVSTIIANRFASIEKYEILILSIVEQNSTTYFTISSKIRRYSLKKNREWMQPGPKYLSLIPMLRHFLVQMCIDVIIDIDIVLDILTIPASLGMTVKVISWEHFHYYFEQQFLYRRIIACFSSLFSDYIITLTQKDKENYEKELHRNRKIEFIYNPITLPKNPLCFSDNKIIPREHILITVGSLNKRKGTDLIAKVIPRILHKYRDWKWFFLGDGEYRKRLEVTVRQYRLEKQVVLTGNVLNVEIYLKRASIFVLSSRMEGLPMCLLEAKAARLPCVSFDIQTGPSEIIQDDVNGFLIKPFDLDMMVKKIELLIKNEELRNRFSQNAVTGMEKFQIDSILQKWERIINSV